MYTLQQGEEVCELDRFFIEELRVLSLIVTTLKLAAITLQY